MISGQPSATTCQTGRPAMLPNAANPPCSHSPRVHWNFLTRESRTTIDDTQQPKHSIGHGIFYTFTKINHSCRLVGGFSQTHLKHMLVNLDHFPNFRGEHQKSWNHHLVGKYNYNSPIECRLGRFLVMNKFSCATPQTPGFRNLWNPLFWQPKQCTINKGNSARKNHTLSLIPLNKLVIQWPVLELKVMFTKTFGKLNYHHFQIKQKTNQLNS